MTGTNTVQRSTTPVTIRTEVYERGTTNRVDQQCAPYRGGESQLFERRRNFERNSIRTKPDSRDLSGWLIHAESHPNGFRQGRSGHSDCRFRGYFTASTATARADGHAYGDAYGNACTDGHAYGDAYGNARTDGHAYGDAHAYARTDGHAYGDAHAYARTDGHAYGDAYGNARTDGHAYGDAHAYARTDGHAYGNGDRHGDAYGNAHRYGDANGNAHRYGDAHGNAYGNAYSDTHGNAHRRRVEVSAAPPAATVTHTKIAHRYGDASRKRQRSRFNGNAHFATLTPHANC